uniref:ARAD1B06710p n=1 Tax=Blastobotrys adeninivorans TaxID=409370 RepID=A0A060T5F9_BLAAD
MSFDAKTVKGVLEQSFAHEDTRVSADAVQAAAEYLRIFTREAVWRSAVDRKEKDSKGEVVVDNQVRQRPQGPLDQENLDAVIPDLVQDF